MASQGNHTMPPGQRRPRSRKSIAHLPSPDKSPAVEEKENSGNSTADLKTLPSLKRSSTSAKSSKKSRSKSIGPGGIDALKEGTGNGRKSTITPTVKSILKPTIPLSPLKEIPTRSATRRGIRPPGLDLPGIGAPTTDMLIDISVPDQAPNRSATVWGTDTLLNPFDSACEKPAEEAAKVALRTEEQQLAAMRDREEQQKRNNQGKNEQERRDARRKSLANRRVSFAPEATLHTWDVVEYFQESTTSTDSTRRASSVSGQCLPETPHSQVTAPSPSSELPTAPSTPPEQAEDAPAIHVSPAHQRDLHQKKRRRQSSGTGALDGDRPDIDVLSSSPYSGSSTGASDDMSTQSLVINNDDDTFNSESESVEGNSTVMSIDEGDSTRQSLVSTRSGSSHASASSGRLDEALRQAAQQAGTQGIEHDENGDLTMEMADDDVTVAFKPWAQKNAVISKSVQDLTSLQDQENQNPFSPAFRAGTATEANQRHKATNRSSPRNGRSPSKTAQANQQQSPSSTKRRRSSIAVGKQRSSLNGRGLSGEETSLGDETMDLTMAVGGIRDENVSEDAASVPDDDEQLSMELTTAIGGVLPPDNEMSPSKSQVFRELSDDVAVHGNLGSTRRGETTAPIDDETAMSMTMPIGSILPAPAYGDDDEDDQTEGMDITTAVGGILPTQTSGIDRSRAKDLMKRETDIGDLANSPLQERPKRHTPEKTLTKTRLNSARKSPNSANSKLPAIRQKDNGTRTIPSPQSPMKQSSTPVKKPSTPSKQLTPVPPKPTTPGKTPPLKNITLRSSSPKKLFKAEIRSARSTPKGGSTKETSHGQDLKPGASTPSIVPAPRRRRSSGVGVDREGLGSPNVTAILDRRRSLGQETGNFSIGHGRAQKKLRIEDPKMMESELDNERREDEQRENGRSILQKEADIEEPEEQDVTANLKEMIQSLTPKKKVKGRKSLHVGTARGLLGKRPAELDEEEEVEDDSSVKRMRGIEGSPVKNVMLPPPPPKAATTGRTTRPSRVTLGETDGNTQDITPSTGASPSKTQLTTPSSQGRYRDAEVHTGGQSNVTPFEEKIAKSDYPVDEAVEEEPIHLQDFLNMTSIRFMELNTTKRRPTIAPNSNFNIEGLEDYHTPAQGSLSDGHPGKRTNFETWVVASACTVPMLELYQHSCRELKKYISEGRKIVREIEVDTFEENPPLFREYITASPDVKFIMDTQFKNVKTHARLLSKAMWYEWRMKLLEGLKEGLSHISEGMNSDDKFLRQQEELLTPALDPLVLEFERVEHENAQLQTRLDELQDCDQEELKQTRNKLIAAEEEILAKQHLFEEMQQQLKHTNSNIASATQRKSECLKEIRDAEKIREECKGWSASEIGSLKAKVDALEHKHGWQIAAVDGTVIKANFKQRIRLTFDVAAFLPNDGSVTPQKQSAPIWLEICGADDTKSASLKVAEAFFVHAIQDQLKTICQGETTTKDLLSFVSLSWARAVATFENIRLLHLHFPTEVVVDGDGVLSVKSMLLLPALATKIQISFGVSARPETTVDNTTLACKPTVIYGDKINETKMQGFLEERVGHRVSGLEDGRGLAWWGAVEALRTKLLARGKK
ncbi:MAG: hypothetical protein M1837_000514 [Sclerophora amabilis]|nr:MAG: hypothetical protein M1837_000514 [Sclerophora amabilis]